MEIKTTYVGTLNGVPGLWCGFLPKGVVVTQQRMILVAQEGFDLIRISDGQNMGGAIWLRDGDVQENYKEEKSVEQTPID